MPFKHQSDSFRTRKGERYVCWSDCPDRDEARQSVVEMRAKSVRVFAEHEGDYSRVFIHQQDAIAAGILQPPEDPVTQIQRILERKK